MKIIKITLLLATIITLTSCASGYKMIEPKSINYVSTDEENGVKLEYKYDLLKKKKYAKKEVKKGILLVAVKIKNNSENDLMFGREIKLTYDNGIEIFVMENDKVFKSLKQRPAPYLFYLLLIPLNLFGSALAYESGSAKDLVSGTGLTVVNMVIASYANIKFKTEMLEYNIYGTIIKKGETKYGLIGIKADFFYALKIKVE